MTRRILTTFVHVRMSPSMRDRLEDLALVDETTVSEQIRRAIIERLDMRAGARAEADRRLLAADPRRIR